MLYYDPFAADDFSEQRCFLCGIELDAANRTIEHVFPKWLIQHFRLNMRGSKAISTKGINDKVRDISYNKITIPCCRSCNSRILAPLERKVMSNFIEYRDQDFSLNENELLLWTSKIFYGLYLRDHLDGKASLKLEDDKNQYTGLRSIFLFLQSLRFRFEFKGNFFFQQTNIKSFAVSAFVFNVKLPRHVRDQFDYKDLKFNECFYLRIGKKAILLSFDGGYLAHHGRGIFQPYLDKLLHPKQMEELAATFFHMGFLKTNVFSFHIINNDNQIVIDYDGSDGGFVTIPPLNYHALITDEPFLSAGAFKGGAFSSDYIFLLSYFTRISQTELEGDEGLVCTWLKGSDTDDFLDIDIDKYPNG